MNYDLTIMNMQRCTNGFGQRQVQGSTGVYIVDINERHISCTCPDYVYRRRALGETCKHIDQILQSGEVCGWDELIGPERQTDSQLENYVCPRCGSDTKVYAMGV